MTRQSLDLALNKLKFDSGGVEVRVKGERLNSIQQPLIIFYTHGANSTNVGVVVFKISIISYKIFILSQTSKEISLYNIIQLQKIFFHNSFVSLQKCTLDSETQMTCLTPATSPLMVDSTRKRDKRNSRNYALKRRNDMKDNEYNEDNIKNQKKETQDGDRTIKVFYGFVMDGVKSLLNLSSTFTIYPDPVFSSVISTHPSTPQQSQTHYTFNVIFIH